MLCVFYFGILRMHCNVYNVKMYLLEQVILYCLDRRIRFFKPMSFLHIVVLNNFSHMIILPDVMVTALKVFTILSVE